MQIVNLTPHTINVLVEDENGEVLGKVGLGRDARETRFRAVADLPSVGAVRATTSKRAVGSVAFGGMQIPVERTVHGRVENLPEPSEEVEYIVSLLVAKAAEQGGRITNDLLVVGESVRDNEGRVIGCISFGRL